MSVSSNRTIRSLLSSKSSNLKEELTENTLDLHQVLKSSNIRVFGVINKRCHGHRGQGLCDKSKTAILHKNVTRVAVEGERGLEIVQNWHLRITPQQNHAINYFSVVCQEK